MKFEVKLWLDVPEKDVDWFKEGPAKSWSLLNLVGIIYGYLSWDRREGGLMEIRELRTQVRTETYDELGRKL